LCCCSFDKTSQPGVSSAVVEAEASAAVVAVAEETDNVLLQGDEQVEEVFSHPSSSPVTNLPPKTSNFCQLLSHFLEQGTHLSWF